MIKSKEIYKGHTIIENYDKYARRISFAVWSSNGVNLISFGRKESAMEFIDSRVDKRENNNVPNS